MEKKNELPLETPPEEQPEVFAVSTTKQGLTFTRREFAELAAVSAGAAILATVATKVESVSAQTTGCSVRTDRDDVTVHVGPGRQRAIRMYLPRNQNIPIVGQARDSNNDVWWQLRIRNIEQAWVADEDVETVGDCSNVSITGTPPVVTASSPRATPTSTAEPVPTGVPGRVGAGSSGIEYSSGGQTFTLPCNSPIPAGAVCVCNCVSVPAACGCNSQCGCVGNSCDCVGNGHYWYPN